MTPYYVYLVRCADNSLYCGIAINPERRVETHNRGKGAKCLRGKLPVILVYKERVESKGAALRREAQIKRFKKSEKELLVMTGVQP